MFSNSVMASLSFLLQMDVPSRNDPLSLSPNKGLLSVKKSSVGRTHSLPNDSYMFQPPATGIYDGSAGEKNPSHQKSQSGIKSFP